MLLTAATVLAVAALGCSSGAGPVDPTEVGTQMPASDSPGPTNAAPTAASAETSDEAGILEPQGPGVTLKSGDSTAVDANGGRYRVAWLAPGCTFLTIEWAPVSGGGVTEVATFVPTGQTFVELPAGPGYLNHVSDCPVTIRFEAAS
jgi:hypothetical protein